MPQQDTMQKSGKPLFAPQLWFLFSNQTAAIKPNKKPNENQVKPNLSKNKIQINKMVKMAF
ncbi:MAG: hypothetical protein WBP13_10755 [Methylophilaceae bacterium]